MADDTQSNRGVFALANWIVLLAAFAGAGLAFAYAYYFVFSRPMSLDEGYLMITLKGFSAGHPLYDSVFTQYGPFYYWYEWLLRTVGRIPLTHDAVRLVCVAHWLIASALLGAAGWRLTSSRLIGLLVGAMAVAHLAPLASEPGHPQETVALLLAAALLVASFAHARWACLLLGAIAAALAFTKINVGLFFGLALALAFVFGWPAFGRYARWLAPILCAALPVLLMRRHLDAAWCKHLAIILSVTIATVTATASRTGTGASMRLRHVGAASAGFLALAFILVSATLAHGTSVAALISGLITTPLKMVGVALLMFETNPLAPWNALLSLVAAFVWFRTHHQARTVAVFALAKQTFALLALLFVGNARNQLQFLLPWTWMVLIQDESDSKHSAQSFARLLVCLCGAWQPLQVYPIAGTQVTLGTLPLVLISGICLSDALRWLARQPRFALQLSALPAGTRLLASTLASVGVLYLLANVWCNISLARRDYARLPALNLPGASRVHHDEETVLQYQALAAYLAKESDTFITYPGLNSLYFWTGKEPPTQVNCTGWGQLSQAQQQHILASVSKAARPKIVVVEAATQVWQTPMYDPIRPLVRYVTEDCTPVKRIGRFVVFQPAKR